MKLFMCPLIALFVFGNVSAETIHLNKLRGNSNYMFDLLQLSLSYSKTQYDFSFTPKRLSKAASKEALLNNDVDVIWRGTSVEMEQQFLPIRIDGYRGLMSMRFMLIRANDQPRFNNVKTLLDLQQIPVGQGRTWTDGKILEHNGLTVRHATKKISLYYMLDGSRFDAFPRGATEAWNEVAKMNELPLKVEDNLIISYPLPTYFFVNQTNTKLAQDIETGLNLALQDGKFDDFFYRNQRVQQFLKQADLQRRRVIELENPFLPKETPLHRKELWLTVDQLILGANKYLTQQ